MMLVMGKIRANRTKEALLWLSETDSRAQGLRALARITARIHLAKVRLQNKHGGPSDEVMEGR